MGLKAMVTKDHTRASTNTDTNTTVPTRVNAHTQAYISTCNVRTPDLPIAIDAT